MFGKLIFKFHTVDKDGRDDFLWSGRLRAVGKA